MAKRLSIKEHNNGKLKVTNQFNATISECYPDGSYAENFKQTLFEMVYAWNESFGRGLDVKTGLPPAVKQTGTFELPLGIKLDSFESVVRYAHELGYRIMITEVEQLNSFSVNLIKPKI